jgi:hypothetical protein
MNTEGSNGVPYAWYGLLLVFVLIFLIANLFRDQKSKDIERAPGKALVFPGAKLLHVTQEYSFLNSGACIQRDYGADVSADVVQTFFDRELESLGYTRVPPVREAHYPGGAPHFVAQYRNADFTYSVYLVPPPLRVAGKTITREYRHVLVTRLSNSP